MLHGKKNSRPTPILYHSAETTMFQAPENSPEQDRQTLKRSSADYLWQTIYPPVVDKRQRLITSYPMLPIYPENMRKICKRSYGCII